MIKEHSINELEQISNSIRGELISYSARTKTPHLASGLSCMDILVGCFFNLMNVYPNDPYSPNRDYFVLSKGHAAPALFHVLSKVGFFNPSELKNANHDGTDVFGEHPPARGILPGNEFATGSLGHGLPLSVGMAIAAKIKNKSNKFFCLLGDGECNEGSVWEAAGLAGKHGLNALTAIVDCNKWQGTDRTENVLSNGKLADKWRAFGWAVSEIDGHDIGDFISVVRNHDTDVPLAVLADTVKGKGVSFMEDDNNWHYKVPSDDDVARSIVELGLS